MSDPGNNSQQEEQQEEEPPRTFLKQEQINEGLSVIARTADGKSYAYSTLNLEEKEQLQELGELLKPYQHLVNLNLSKNEDLRDISAVAELPNLLTL